MPIRRQRCLDCGAEMEDLCVRSDDKPREECDCGSKRLEPVMGRTSFALRGGGWAADNYGSSK